MNLKQWYISTFKRSEAVIIYVAHETGRITHHWCIPYIDDTVKVEGLDKAVVISRETQRLSTKWNIPTFFVHHSNCESIDLDDVKKGYFTTKELRLILDNDEADKIFRVTDKGGLTKEATIILGVVVLGFLGMFYLFNTKMNEVKNLIVEPAPIVEVVESE